jgi:hypothetical protein
MGKIMSLCDRRKVAHENYVRSAWCAHGGTSWWEDNKRVFGEKNLLARNEGRFRTLH